MTTSLIAGLTREQAVEAIRAKAVEQLRPGDRFGLWVESGRKQVLVGLARPDTPPVILEFDLAEWDGMKFLEQIGVDMTPTRPAPIEQARKAKRGKN